MQLKVEIVKQRQNYQYFKRFGKSRKKHEENSVEIRNFLLKFEFSCFIRQSCEDWTKYFVCIHVIEHKNKSGEFKMTHQATANRFSLFSLIAPVVASILS